MCRHVWQTYNDVRVCMRCGLTVCLLDGKIMHDVRLQSVLSKKRKGKQ